MMPTSVNTPINAGVLNKLYVLFLFKLLSQRYLRRWRKGPMYIIYISSKLCLKIGWTNRLTEAHTMQFISQNTSIPVPKVYTAFEHKGRTFILMERIDGAPLCRGWVNRSDASKAKILGQLKAMIDELRSIPLPEGFVGVADFMGKGPFYDSRLPGKTDWGPFPTIDAFHQELSSGNEIGDFCTEKILAIYPGIAELAVFYRQGWPKPTFTHGDLSSMNILARGDDVVAIIDWETAGWMPPYWEYTSNWHVNPYNTFWQAEVEKFVTPDPHALQMDIIRRQCFGDV